MRDGATRQLADAQHGVPTLMSQVTDRATAHLAAGRQRAEAHITAVLQRARIDVTRSAEDAQSHMRTVGQEAHRAVQTARTRSEALIREISGQGPQKTLGRGFAMVRNEHGATVASAADVEPGASIQVTFHDGALDARVLQPHQEAR